MISDLTLSFYLSGQTGNMSFVKFGGFDVNAIIGATTDNLRVYRTNSVNSWEISGTSFRFGSEAIFGESVNEVNIVDINPEYSYIYMPDRLFLKFIEKLS